MEFNINFVLDDNFQEKLLSRFRDEFIYNNFSEGEKQRIDLALLFTWRDIAQMKNSASTNLIVLDEILDSSLDYVGIDSFLDIIHKDGDKGRNIFIITPKADSMSDKFDSIIKFNKKNNFTYIEED